MEPIVSIPQSVLARLVASHSRLAQAEYYANRGYNNEHYSHKAEDAFLDFVKNMMDDDDAERFWKRVQFFAESVK